MPYPKYLHLGRQICAAEHIKQSWCVVTEALVVSDPLPIPTLTQTRDWVKGNGDSGAGDNCGTGFTFTGDLRDDPAVKSIPWTQAHLYVASLPRRPSKSRAHWATRSSALCSQSRSTWATRILAAWSTCLLFDVLWYEIFLAYMTHVYSTVFYPGSDVLPQFSSSDGFSSVLPVDLLLLQ